MKLSIKKQKSPNGQEYYVIYDWYWYNCGLYNSLEKAEETIINIFEEEKLRRQKNQIREEVVYELRDGEILRTENV
jgi:hypothetical protein